MSYKNASATAILNGRRNGVDAGYLMMGWVRQTDFTASFITSINCDPYGTNGASYRTDTGGDQTSFGNSESTFSPILTGSTVAWVFCCWAINPGVGVTFYWRLEGQASLQSRVVTDSGNTGGNYSICGDFNGSNVLQYLSAYKEWSNFNSLTSAQILAESKQKVPIVTTGLTNYLSCDNGSTVGTDQSGVGGNTNWTVVGTITTDALEPNMSTALYVQAAQGNLGNGSPGTVTFANAQIAANCNVIAVMEFDAGGGLATTNVTSLTDDAGNTYTKQQYIANASAGVAVYLFTCLSIASHAAGNGVHLAWSSANFMDMVPVELPHALCGSIRTGNTAFQFGGTAIHPTVNLTGTTAGDLVFAWGKDNNNNLSLAGTIGANPAYLIENEPSGDAFICQVGLSDGSSPCAVTIGLGPNVDNYEIAALAFVPAATGTLYDISVNDTPAVSDTLANSAAYDRLIGYRSVTF